VLHAPFLHIQCFLQYSFRLYANQLNGDEIANRKNIFRFLEVKEKEKKIYIHKTQTQTQTHFFRSIHVEKQNKNCVNKYNSDFAGKKYIFSFRFSKEWKWLSNGSLEIRGSRHARFFNHFSTWQSVVSFSKLENFRQYRPRDTFYRQQIRLLFVNEYLFIHSQICITTGNGNHFHLNERLFVCLSLC
jgi:hypothetical protein